MPTVSAGRVAEIFVEVADTMVAEFDLVDFLQKVTTRSTELASADAAGLLLADARKRLQFMAASDERTHMLELFQLQADEGPCRDCFSQGVAVVADDLTSAGGQWPAFAPQATAAGFRSVHAFPLRLRREVIGVLGLFSADAGALAVPDVRIIQALADIATIGLLQERAIRRGEVLTEQLQGALNSRIVIEQAKGAIAQTHGITVDEAFELLRDHVRRNRLHLTEVARTLVADPAKVRALRAPRTDH
jgi:transcriptional regulator with GAF, ATPase, and Fis domain